MQDCTVFLLFISKVWNSPHMDSYAKKKKLRTPHSISALKDRNLWFAPVQEFDFLALSFQCLSQLQLLKRFSGTF